MTIDIKKSSCSFHGCKKLFKIQRVSIPLIQQSSRRMTKDMNTIVFNRSTNAHCHRIFCHFCCKMNRREHNIKFFLPCFAQRKPPIFKDVNFCAMKDSHSCLFLNTCNISSLFRKPLFIEGMRNANLSNMIGDGDKFPVKLLSTACHRLDGINTIAPCSMHLKITKTRTVVQELWQPMIDSCFQLTEILTKFRLHKINAKFMIDIFFSSASNPFLSFQGKKPILAQCKPFLQRNLPQLNIVCFIPGKILECTPEFSLFNDTQINLQAIMQNNRTACFTMSENTRNFFHMSKMIHHLC